MAKKLNIITAGGNLPFANNGLKLSENILIEKIEEHEKFKSLFSIDKTLLDRIAGDMAKNSFDSSQPVHIWVTRDENEKLSNVVDKKSWDLFRLQSVRFHLQKFYLL